MKVNVFLVFIFFAFSAAAQLDSNAVVVIRGTRFIGNEKTQEFILVRELTYNTGDSVQWSELETLVARSRENIFNTALFNKASYHIQKESEREVSIIFTLEERWYVWPYLILENGDRNFNTWWQTKNFNRLSYGVNLHWNNFRGRNETLQGLVKVGFENQFSLAYNIPNLNKAKTLGLFLASGYAGYREVNYQSNENKRNFYKSISGPAKEVVFGRVAMTYRKGLNFRHRLELAFQEQKIDSAVLELSSDYLKNNQAKTDYFSLNYYGKYDTRDYIEYPLKGYKIELYVSKYGLGVLENEGLNVLTTTGGLYWHKPVGGRWYFANSVVGKLSFFDDPPYSIQAGLGYKNYVRGYELYVMDAQNYGLIKTNLKFELISKKEYHLKKLPIEKFNKPYFSVYMNAFVDCGFADDKLYAEMNSLSNKWAVGYGVGFDVTAYYDFVMRLEYSFNLENEGGFFLHFKKSI